MKKAIKYLFALVLLACGAPPEEEHTGSLEQELPQPVKLGWVPPSGIQCVHTSGNSCFLPPQKNLVIARGNGWAAGELTQLHNLSVTVGTHMLDATSTWGFTVIDGPLGGDIQGVLFVDKVNLNSTPTGSSVRPMHDLVRVTCEVAGPVLGELPPVSASYRHCLRHAVAIDAVAMTAWSGEVFSSTSFEFRHALGHAVAKAMGLGGQSVSQATLYSSNVLHKFGAGRTLSTAETCRTDAYQPSTAPLTVFSALCAGTP
jgi:hypothetical protein